MPEPTPPPPRRRRMRLLRVAFGVLLLAGIWVALDRAGDVVGEAVAVAADVPITALVALAACFVVERVLRAMVVRTSLPGTSLGQGAVLNEVGAATSGGIPAGGAVGAGLRVAMARSWGRPTAASWLSIAAANEAFAVAARTLALLVVLPGLVARRPDLVDVGIVVALTGSMVASAGLWILLSRETRLLRWWRHRATRWHAWTARWIPHGGYRRFRPAVWIDRFRDATAVLLRRPVALLLPALLGHAVGGLLFLIAVRSVGVDLDVLTIAKIHFVGKVAAGFAPTPGGVGVVEAGLTAALVAAGVPDVEALAGVLLARGFTYALPIGLGAASVLAWRFLGAGRPAAPGDARLAGERSDTDDRPVPALAD